MDARVLLPGLANYSVFVQEARGLSSRRWSCAVARRRTTAMMMMLAPTPAAEKSAMAAILLSMTAPIPTARQRAANTPISTSNWNLCRPRIGITVTDGQVAFQAFESIARR